MRKNTMPHWGKGQLQILEKKIFTMRVVKQWNKLPREVDDAPCLLVLKRHLSNYKSSFFLTASLHALYSLCSQSYLLAFLKSQNLLSLVI